MNFMLVPLFDLIFLLGCVAAWSKGIKNRAGLAQRGKPLNLFGRFRVKGDSQRYRWYRQPIL